MSVESDLTKGDIKSWIRTIWYGLGPFQDQFEDDNFETEEITNDWDEICTAMAWITEELGLDSSDPDTHGG